MSSLHGTEETKEALEAVLEVAVCLIDRFKDGVQLSDISALWDKLSNDSEFQAIILKAQDNVSAVPTELAGLDAKEAVEVFGGCLLKYFPKIYDAFKKEMPAPMETPEA